jgi:hypothetical protein
MFKESILMCRASKPALLASNLYFGSPKSEFGSTNLYFGSRKSNLGSRNLNLGSRNLNLRNRKSEFESTKSMSGNRFSKRRSGRITGVNYFQSSSFFQVNLFSCFCIIWKVFPWKQLPIRYKKMSRARSYGMATTSVDAKVQHFS